MVGRRGARARWDWNLWRVKDNIGRAGRIGTSAWAKCPRQSSDGGSLVGLLVDSLKILRAVPSARDHPPPGDGDAQPAGVPINENQIRRPPIQGPDDANRELSRVSWPPQMGITLSGNPDHAASRIQEALHSCHSQPHFGLLPELKAISTSGEARASLRCS